MSRYAEAHSNRQGPGDQRPTALQIVQDNLMEGKLTGKVVVITGVSSGLGIEVARALVKTGATLYLTARDISKAEAALGSLLERDQVHLVRMEQTSLSSVREAAEIILAKTSAANTGVNILICNAAVMCLPAHELTSEGYEVHFVTNHLSHFLLFNLLKHAMLAAAARSDDFQSRVVMVSSSSHRASGINPSDNYHFEKGGYQPPLAYAQSKTANIYMANQIEREYGAQGLHGLSLHPGLIETGLSRFIPQEYIDALRADENVVREAKSPEQGAATIIYAAVDKEWEGRGGRYLVDCSEAVRGADDGDVMSLTYTSHTYLAADERRLWGDSLEMVGLADH
ncbi:uncharacterized protein BJX67DRAFT_386891 [Aspergillus lucknowensis]|uniref:Short-chain dehydrogenase n=1 Tax=Aspergillus lucknowensis TaxID=176173 RepID=A0ABR4M7J2_9EURO